MESTRRRRAGPHAVRTLSLLCRLVISRPTAHARRLANLADRETRASRGIQLAHLSLVFMRPFTFWRGSAAAGPADAEPLFSLLDSIVKWSIL
jgi:hypothetical protein